MNKRLFILLFLALAAYGQQTSVAVLPSEGTILSNDELEALTDKMRESALKVLPTNAFVLLKQDVVVRRLGGAEKYIKECSESSCIVDLGKKAQVDYVAQASVGKLGNRIRLKVELYNVRTEGLVGMLSGEAENIDGLLDIVEKRVPTEVFGKIPGSSVGSKASPLVAGGISGLEKTADYEFGGGKRYLVNLSSEPSGAILSFNGMPAASCPKTPCKIELGDGNVRIIAALEQHETVDTTVSIARNNQSIAIRLKSSFGILYIKPAYIDDIGEEDNWNLTINDRAYSSFENKFSPGNYNVKLNHRCYEPVNFMAGINKGSREVFDMSKHIKLKKGGLALSAEKNGEPASEPVFVNGKQVGETPFIDAVPLCSEIEIGENRETVSVVLKHNEKVRYKHKLDIYEPVQALGDSYAEKDSEDSRSGMSKLLKFVFVAGLAGAGVVVAISKGVGNNDLAYERYKDYKGLRQGSAQDYEDAWNKAEKYRKDRNMYYIIGGALLVSGIGVQIWF